MNFAHFAGLLAGSRLALVCNLEADQDLALGNISIFVPTPVSRTRWPEPITSLISHGCSNHFPLAFGRPECTRLAGVVGHRHSVVAATKSPGLRTVQEEPATSFSHIQHDDVFPLPSDPLVACKFLLATHVRIGNTA